MVTSATARSGTVPPAATGDGLGAHPGGFDPPGTLPQHFDRPGQRPLELLGAHRKEQREDRIRNHPGLDQIGAGQAKQRERFSKVGVVPEGERYGLVDGDPVLESAVARRAATAHRQRSAVGIDGVVRGYVPDVDRSRREPILDSPPGQSGRAMCGKAMAPP
jgi:hypothetical protein